MLHWGAPKSAMDDGSHVHSCCASVDLVPVAVEVLGEHDSFERVFDVGAYGDVRLLIEMNAVREADHGVPGVHSKVDDLIVQVLE